MVSLLCTTLYTYFFAVTPDHCQMICLFGCSTNRLDVSAAYTVHPPNLNPWANLAPCPLPLPALPFPWSTLNPDYSIKSLWLSMHQSPRWRPRGSTPKVLSLNNDGRHVLRCSKRNRQSSLLTSVCDDVSKLCAHAECRRHESVRSTLEFFCNRSSVAGRLSNWFGEFTAWSTNSDCGIKAY